LGNLEILDDKSAWRDLNALVRIRSTCTVGDITSIEDRFYLTSLPLDAQKIMGAIGLHWGIENGLHWILDTAFKEDLNRARNKHAQANLVAVRHLAVNVLKQDKSIKAGIETKRARASWDNNFLLSLLAI
jgi:predicted transposase YbfD/YdcC